MGRPGPSANKRPHRLGEAVRLIGIGIVDAYALDPEMGEGVVTSIGAPTDASPAAPATVANGAIYHRTSTS